MILSSRYTATKMRLATFSKSRSPWSSLVFKIKDLDVVLNWEHCFKDHRQTQIFSVFSWSGKRHDGFRLCRIQLQDWRLGLKTMTKTMTLWNDFLSVLEFSLRLYWLLLRLLTGRSHRMSPIAFIYFHVFQIDWQTCLNVTLPVSTAPSHISTSQLLSLGSNFTLWPSQCTNHLPFAVISAVIIVIIMGS